MAKKEQKHQFHWHQLDSTLPTYRAKVPDGWLVAIVKEEGCGLAFYPDATHEWNGRSLPIEKLGQVLDDFERRKHFEFVEEALKRSTKVHQAFPVNPSLENITTFIAEIKPKELEEVEGLARQYRFAIGVLQKLNDYRADSLEDKKLQALIDTLGKVIRAIKNLRK